MMARRISTRWSQLSPARRLEIVILLCACALWLWAGLSTWNDLIGKPKDAPFLRVPGHVRSVVLWWTPALVAAFAAVSRRGVSLAFSLLSMGPAVRFTSYLVSWVTSWEWMDRMLDDSLITGDPHAWGSAWIYLVIITSVGGLSYAIGKLWQAEATESALRREIARLRRAKGVE